MNLTMARAKGWTVGGQGGGGAAGGSRNLNYSIPALREWHALALASRSSSPVLLSTIPYAWSEWRLQGAVASTGVPLLRPEAPAQ